jgi:hypothetical protein
MDIENIDETFANFTLDMGEEGNRNHHQCHSGSCHVEATITWFFTHLLLGIQYG